MSKRHTLSHLPGVRRIFLKALKAVSRDITIKNPWTGDPLRLNLYSHKGYWYFGRERERESMQQFAQMIREGDTVLEVGGHIGYITQYFAKLVGSEGKVVVFEPGTNNRPYIEHNLRTLSNAVLECAAVSSSNGETVLYEDNISGQNNSLLSDYARAESVSRTHPDSLIRSPHIVKVVTLDSYVSTHAIEPDFVKIDVEGLEHQVLLGATQMLKKLPKLMVEVTEQHKDVMQLLQAAGFQVFNASDASVDSITQSGNYFARRATAPAM